MRAILFVAAAALALSACNADSAEPGDAASAPSEVTGVIVAIDRSGEDVTAFEVRDGERSFEILIDAEKDYGFPLEHLEEHRKTEAPVEVELDPRSDGLYAVSIVDVVE